MTKLVSIRATPDVPVACDMTTAADSLAVRRPECRRLFDHALVARDSTATATTVRFAEKPGVRDWVLDLVRREAACCAFLSFEVDAQDNQLVWTTTGLGASDLAVFDDFLGPGPAEETSTAMGQRLTDLGGMPVIVPADRQAPRLWTPSA